MACTNNVQDKQTNKHTYKIIVEFDRRTFSYERVSTLISIISPQGISSRVMPFLKRLFLQTEGAGEDVSTATDPMETESSPTADK